MNWKIKIILFYTLVGFAGVGFVEFHNLFILEISWKDILIYNLPFVLLQNLIFIIVYYLYTIKKIGYIFRNEQQESRQLTESEKKKQFEELVSFPGTLFKFSIVFMIGLALSYHLYEIVFIYKITKEFVFNLFFNLLREIAIGMVITLMIVAALRKIIRPYILQMGISTIANVHLSLSKKIYSIFFSILFIFVADITWLVLYMEGTVESQIIKGLITVCLLSIFAVVVIRLTILDSINYIQTIAQTITTTEKDEQKLLQSFIPITSSDEIAFLIGKFNKQQAKLQQLYKELEGELKFASTVQQNLLPKQNVTIAGYMIEGLSLPVKEVGGDFFDIIKITEKKMIILIGDVSGKGVPAALLMSATLGVIRSKTQTDVISPARLLNEMNHLLVPMLSDGMYITIGIGFIDIEKNLFTYASAGHVPPLIKEKNRLEFVEISSLPLGLDEDETYEEFTLSLNALDGVILFTDGMVEQMNEQQEIFGFERFYQLFSSEWNPEIKSYMSQIDDFCGKYKRNDDMTIVRLKKTNPCRESFLMKKIQLINIKIASELGEEKKVLKQLDEQLANYSFLKEDCDEFKAALAEVCINAIEHGNQEDKQKLVHVIVSLEDNVIEGKIFDYGTGFICGEKKKDERGWGLQIVQQFVDSWTMYQELGIHSQFCVQFEKRLRALE